MRNGLPSDDDLRSRVGVVVIGRNEGRRLRACLESVLATCRAVVYVDSGSTDDSVAVARELGAETIELDASAPYCAARARNAGFEHLATRWPHLRFVQFIDGDCELLKDWLDCAVARLNGQPTVAIVAGWLRERNPEASVYNRIAEFEWNSSPPGEVDAVGGIFLIRREAFEQVGGFNPSVPAGEEPELCQRLKARGWRIVRLDRDMAWHDLAMTRYIQWWRRAFRFGYACSDLARRFGVPKYRRAAIRTRLWALWLLLALAGGVSAAYGARGTGWFAAAWIALWPLQTLRVARRVYPKCRSASLAGAYATLVMTSFIPQFAGHVTYLVHRISGVRPRLIEYKLAPPGKA